ncbi:hypothetical protein PVMG_05333 [Plasmodium vivax Mauritania I]|uniref:Variable surface protein Vir7-like protein n=1 Tax=Plasmodium vivax Mauritania I TaxID=1035515 RepID=A0A0J9TKE1_PLAVI|nr:hypothetical protein PVMG_05333 [Plasmodium vivax Mauritania I]
MVTAYEEFNSDVIDEYSSTIESLMSVLKSWGWYEEKHKDIYKKLTRNLLLLLNKKYMKMNKEDYCRFLYQWVYHTQKKYDINEYYISVFYQAVHASIISAGASNYCPYYSYDKDYENSINIIKLQNFHHNINTIRDILIKKSASQDRNSQYCYAQRYANECVKIYRNMYDEFCAGDKSSILKNQKTCSELSTFNNIYTTFLFNQGDINKKIPDLASEENEKLFGCPADESTALQEWKQGSGPALGKGTLSSPGQGMGTVAGPGQGSISDGVEQSDNPKPFNTTSVVSAMAGIPPFLALIYKVYIFLHKTIKNT